MESSAFAVTIKGPGVSSWGPEGITRDFNADQMVELCRRSQDFYDLISGGPIEDVLNDHLRSQYPPEHFTKNYDGEVLYQEGHELYCEASGAWRSA